jgi:hypothetical protein
MKTTSHARPFRIPNSAFRIPGGFRIWPVVLLLAACQSAQPVVEAPQPQTPPPDAASLVNFAHLDYLGEQTVPSSGQFAGDTLRIIHIYAEAPDYEWFPDDDEGAACVDDAARAAVVYLEHFRDHGSQDARRKAKELVRFVRYMQRDDGLFYNFVWDADLVINEEHENSVAEPFGWWAARAVWALGMAADVLAESDPAFAREAADAALRSLPHAEKYLEQYPETKMMEGYRLPAWLLYEHAADATSELLLGLAALRASDALTEDEAAYVKRLGDRFGEGIALMQFGSMDQVPYGAHASWVGAWHGWGNSQTQALAEYARLPSQDQDRLLASARREADHFFPRILVDGWLHSFDLQTGEPRHFEQIAYATRAVALGLLRLYEATGEEQYATMAGLAASWLTGNNVADFAMYDPATGRGYDGIGSYTFVNINSGAESTIEALYTLHEVAQVPEAARWLYAEGDAAQETRDADGSKTRHRTFTTPEGESITVVMDLGEESVRLCRNAECRMRNAE